MTERNQNEHNQNQEQTQEQVQARKFVGRPEDLVFLPAEDTEAVEVEMTQDDDAAPEAPRAVHHATVKGANLAVARKEISADSCRAVIAGELSLQQAKVYGRDADRNGNPVVSETSKKKAPKKSKEQTPCICGCGETSVSGNRFRPGHDMKMFRIAREALAGERELTDEQHAYLESSGKMAKVVAKAEADKAKREAKIAAKAEAQRVKEGEAEAKKRAKTIAEVRGSQPTDADLEAEGFRQEGADAADELMDDLTEKQGDLDQE